MESNNKILEQYWSGTSVPKLIKEHGGGLVFSVLEDAGGHIPLVGRGFMPYTDPERFEIIQDLFRDGRSVHFIKNLVGSDERTIKKWKPPPAWEDPQPENILGVLDFNWPVCARGHEQSPGTSYTHMNGKSYCSLCRDIRKAYDQKWKKKRDSLRAG